MHLGIGPLRSPPSSAAQSSLHRSLTVPPAGGGPTGGWPRVSCLGLARSGPARSNPATRRSATSPDTSPGSRVGPQLHRTGRRHVPRFTSPHEGFLNPSLSDPSPRAFLPWETLPGAFKPSEPGPDSYIKYLKNRWSPIKAVLFITALTSGGTKGQLYSSELIRV
ncbi:hypothetical protein AMECASPLE_038700 [Ameca splendens]|uniref:Uncharacterized protein n=1 Tax=Ameca splendens TaxID=208324 RepID=A0ABV0ZHG7_9TELE